MNLRLSKELNDSTKGFLIIFDKVTGIISSSNINNLAASVNAIVDQSMVDWDVLANQHLNTLLRSNSTQVG